MTIRQSFMLVIASFCAPLVVFASQKRWKLQECMDYAKRNNMQIRKLRYDIEKAQLALNSAKYSRLPSLSSSASQNFSYGRSLSLDNTYVNQNVKTTSFSLSSDMPLFTGFRISNTIKLNMLNYLACKSDVETMENLVCLNVFEAYVQILCNKEYLKISNYQVKQDSIQLEGLRILEKTGRLSYVEVSKQKALLSQSRLVNMQNFSNLRSSFLALTQLMNLKSFEDFDVENSIDSVFNDEIDNPMDIYNSALMERPEIQTEKYRADASLKAIKIAKSYRYPQLSLSGGLSTHYYYSSQSVNENFFSQLKNKFSKSFTFNLNIPIFNRFETKNNIKKSEFEYESQILVLENVKTELYQTIQHAYNKAVNAKMNYAACVDAVTSCKDAFDLVLSKYDVGLANVLEYSDAKSKYIESECKLLQAKFELLFAIKALRFYGGKPLGI